MNRIFNLIIFCAFTYSFFIFLKLSNLIQGLQTQISENAILISELQKVLYSIESQPLKAIPINNPNLSVFTESLNRDLLYYGVCVVALVVSIISLFYITNAVSCAAVSNTLIYKTFVYCNAKFLELASLVGFSSTATKTITHTNYIDPISGYMIKMVYIS